MVGVEICKIENSHTSNTTNTDKSFFLENINIVHKLLERMIKKKYLKICAHKNHRNVMILQIKGMVP